MTSHRTKRIPLACELIDKRLHDYAHGLLPHGLANRITAHLLKCPQNHWLRFSRSVPKDPAKESPGEPLLTWQ